MAENKSKDKKVVSNVAKLDADHPIPFEQKGLSHIAEKSYRYLPFLGDSDDFFETLAETRLLSPTCNACVSTKVKYSIGTGWTFKDEALDNLFKEHAKRMNKKGESLNAILKKVFDNLYTSGNCFINIVRAKVGDKSKIRVFVKNNFDSRLAYNEDPDKVEFVIFNSNFRTNSGYTQLKNDQIEVPLWTGEPDMKWNEDSDGNEHICIHIKNEVASCDNYGLPSNVASLLQQQMEYKGARYNIDNFENNLVLGGILLLKSNMSEAEAKKHGKKIVDTHSGDGKRGRIMIMASEEGFEDAKFIPFDKAAEGSFLDMDKRIEEKIIIANEWDATLAGINTGSSLGRGTGYFKEIFEVKYKTVIRPEQEKVIEGFLKPLLQIMDQANGTKFANADIDIVTPMPVSYGTSIDPNSVLTVDEGREFLGREPLSGETGSILIGNTKTAGNVPDKQA